MTQSERGGRIPADSFRIRLAIVRTEMGWNYDQAEAATNISSESWRLWEKGQRHCSDVIGVSRKIAEVTPYDQTWLALGGPLAEEEPPTPRQRPMSRGASSTRVRTQSSRGCMRTTRRARFLPPEISSAIAHAA
jgi:transcriptional regulator with XRE-family HTH domain